MFAKVVDLDELLKTYVNYFFLERHLAAVLGKNQIGSFQTLILCLGYNFGTA